MCLGVLRIKNTNGTLIIICSRSCYRVLSFLRTTKTRNKCSRPSLNFSPLPKCQLWIARRTLLEIIFTLTQSHKSSFLRFPTAPPPEINRPHRQNPFRAYILPEDFGANGVGGGGGRDSDRRDGYLNNGYKYVWLMTTMTAGEENKTIIRTP